MKNTKQKTKKESIVDPASGSGIYEGDLRYGRCNGTKVSRKGDFTANRKDGVATNQPVVSLSPAFKRDSEVWKRDPKVLIAKRKVSNSQHIVNYLLHSFAESMHGVTSNVHIRIGRQLL